MKQEFISSKITEFSQRYPDKTAIKSDNHSVSYLELEKKSNRIANFLKERIEKSKHIIILLDRSPELIEAIIGVLKSGSVFVPLSPSLPPNRVKKMIEEIRAEWVITSAAHYETFKYLLKGNNNGTGEITLKTLLIDAENNGLQGSDSLLFEPVFNNDCYIYFTSGSTGTPKGVLGRQTSLAHFIQWEIEEFGVTEDFHVSQFTPPSFDPYLRDIFLPLMTGSTSHIPSNDTLMNMRKLIRWIDDNEITLIHTVPALFKKMAYEIQDSNRFFNLKYILLAGELLRGRDIYKFVQLFNHRIQLVNVYGPTETTLAKLFYRIKPEDANRSIIPVGKPINGAQVLILDSKKQKCRPGKKGEIYIRTPFISSGYYNDPQLNKKVFLKNPYGSHPNDMIYKTGDLGRRLPDGLIELSGRVDFQVKVRGGRIELGEVENRLLKHRDVKEAVVTAKDDQNGDKYLCAYVIPTPDQQLNPAVLREYLSEDLPNYMIPTFFVPMEKMPLTTSGKIDRNALPTPEEFDPNPGNNYLAPEDMMEKQIAEIWSEVLQREKVGINHHFFDLGGNSLKIIEMNSKLNKVFKQEIPVKKLFEHSTIRSLAAYLREIVTEKALVQEPTAAAEPRKSGSPSQSIGIRNGNHSDYPPFKEIAVIGMALRFPGAKNIEEYWNNLKEGRETITFFSQEELVEAGVSPELAANPNYVKAASLLEDKEWFDAHFFGYTPKEAELMDPQIRIFHECSWEALEDGGINPDTYEGSIGVYAGAVPNLEWEARAFLLGKTHALGTFAASKLTGIRYLCTRLSYNLNLKGPSVTMQTACSTSLVAIHMACQALVKEECDIAIAGGITASAESHQGYLHEEGMILSSDGHNRTFDSKGNGTLFGEGAGVVVLKPLADALENRDHVYAVIKGSAINNDGNRKVGFTAPSVGGQVDVIRTAHQVAGIEPESIGYIETHGTATALGDPIEIEALTQTVPSLQPKTCKLGCVKSNFGHLDAASGAAGFIKTVLALKHKMIPPSLHFERPNPEFNLENTPFEVNTQLTEWTPTTWPLRAGVSSLGMGGTNAHVILEEASPEEESSPGRKYHNILLSATSEHSLNRATTNLVDFLKKNPAINLADVAYTLQVGRKAFPARRMLVCSDVQQVIEQLSSPNSAKVKTYQASKEEGPVIFMFPGLGSQYVNMGLELYQNEPLFRQEMDRCFDILNNLVDYNLKEILYPGISTGKQSPLNSNNFCSSNRSYMSNSSYILQINHIEIAQVVVFSFEYALARLLIQWGIEPKAMIGYSFGEYTAACIAGVFSLEEALKLVLFRGKLIERIPSGVMVSVPLTREQVKPLLTDELSLAIDNGASCIIGGPKPAVEVFEKQMKEKRQMCMRLPNTHALHSPMMAPILKEFEAGVRQISLNDPKIPLISNVTGDWLQAGQAADPGYWARHLRHTVQFADGIKKLLKEPRAIFLEIGPGGDLSALIQRYLHKDSTQQVLHLVRQPQKRVSDLYYLQRQIGNLWLKGKKINWHRVYAQEKRRIVSLPTYPFERKRYWIDENFSFMNLNPHQESLSGDGNYPFFTSSWEPSALLTPSWETQPPPSCRMVFMHEDSLSTRLVKRLETEQGEVFRIIAGTRFKKVDQFTYTINPREITHYQRLIKDIRELGKIPAAVVHLWNVIEKEDQASGFAWMDQVQDLGLYSLLFLVQALGQLVSSDADQSQPAITVITNQMQKVPGQASGYPEKATLLGFVNSISRENPHIKCRSIDIVSPVPGSWQEKKLVEQLVSEIISISAEPVIALRDSDRLVPALQPIPMELSTDTSSAIPGLKKEGVYLITGGLEGIGFAFAQYLAHTVQAKLVLIQWNLQTPGNGNNPIGDEIIRLKQLQDQGTKVLVLGVDLAHPGQIDDVIASAEKKFGRINGVIHTAPVHGDVKEIMNTSREMMDRVLTGLKGTLTLENYFKDSPLDFFAICSRQNPAAGPAAGLGNAAVTAFFHLFTYFRSSQNKFPTASINWLQSPEVQDEVVSEKIAQVFHLILNTPFSQLKVNVESVKKENNLYPVQSPGETPSTSSMRRPDLNSEYVAPSNDIQEQLVRIYQNFLGIEPIGIHDDFLELGIDSLKTISLGIEIYKEFDVKIQLEILFGFTNLFQLAEYISRAQNGDLEQGETLNVTGLESEDSHTDSPKEDFTVDKSWNIEELSTAREAPQSILLTGATGFMGAHVLKELIDQTEARIYCLLRGDKDKLYQRGKEKWDFYFNRSFEKHYGKRIMVINGDVAKPNLGMEKDVYDDLAGKLDTVIHSAADVRFYGKYDGFKETNVMGTQRVIDFCFSGKEKKLHHVSTMGIRRGMSTTGIFKESDLDIGQNFGENNVYARSKFEAEKVLYRARRNGLKASIYRLGNLVGRFTDGFFQKNIETHYLYNQIKFLTMVEKFPSHLKEMEFEMIPVDLCSQSLVHLLLLKDALGYNFHLFNPNYLRYQTLVQYMNEFGYGVEIVDSQTFSDHVYSAIKSEAFKNDLEISKIFYSLGEQNNETQDKGSESNPQTLLNGDNTFTTEVLKKTGFSWCRLDFEYMTKLLQHCVDVGYIKSSHTNQGKILQNPNFSLKEQSRAL